MTVAIAARFKGGVLCATDSAITTGGSRIERANIKGFAKNGSFYLFAGAVYYAQRVEFSEQDTIRNALIEVAAEADEDSPEDGCNLVEVTPSGQLVVWEYTGGFTIVEDYAAVGSGADMALFGLDLVYQPNRSEKWLREHIANIIEKIEKRDTGVFRPIHWQALYDSPT